MARLDSDTSNSSDSNHDEHHQHHQHQQQQQQQHTTQDNNININSSNNITTILHTTPTYHVTITPFTDLDTLNYNSESSDSDGTQQSEDEAEGKAFEAKVAEIEELINKEPLVYRNHAELISMLTTAPANKKLISCYEKLKELCPLSSHMWRSWIRLEKCWINESGKNILDFYAKARLDCYDIDLYCCWCMDSMSTDNTQITRDIMEKCIKAAGCDPVKGSLIWDTVREYELAFLSLMKTTSDIYPEQAKRIFDLYSKQLSLPILVAKDTLEDFDKFVETLDNVIPDIKSLAGKVKSTHEAAVGIYNKIIDHENILEEMFQDDSDADYGTIYDAYLVYITAVKELETSVNDESNMFVRLLSYIYDRATTDCCAVLNRTELDYPEINSEELCLDYLHFAKTRLSNEECLDVLNKITRRCPRNVKLWIMKINHLEEVGTPLEDIKSALEEALSAGFSTAADYVSVWLCYLETLRRFTNFSSSQEVDRLRNTFRLAWDSLGQMWGDTADVECFIMLFWMRIEYQLTQDFECGKEIFEEIIGYGNNRLYPHFWNEFIAMERIRGGITRARAAFKRAVKNCDDQTLQWGWYAMERDFGTLATMTECTKICTDKLKEFDLNQTTDHNYSYNFDNNANNKHHKKNWPRNKQEKFTKKKVKPKKTPPNSSFEKRKRKYDEMDSGKIERKPKAEATPADSDLPEEDVFAVPKAPQYRPKRKNESSDDSPSKRLKTPTDSDCPPPPGYTPDCPPPPGYTPDEQKTDSNSAEDELNNRTAFISNLAFKTDEDVLKQKLSEYGEVTELRLMKNGKTFGCICYCVYSDEKAVNVALSHDRELLNDRPMFISRYNSDKERKKHFNYSTGIERNKLFVKSIPYDHCTNEKLTEIFEKYGKLKDIRIVSFKTGKPKGIAYIEYENEKSASAAIQGADGLDINGRQLNVALSAPPPKKTDSVPASAQPNTSFTSHPSTSRNSKTRLFIPSVLRKNPPKP